MVVPLYKKKVEKYRGAPIHLNILKGKNLPLKKALFGRALSTREEKVTIVNLGPFIKKRKIENIWRGTHSP